jgi:hypothetical protein
VTQQSANSPQEVRPRPTIADEAQRSRRRVSAGQTVFSRRIGSTSCLHLLLRSTPLRRPSPRRWRVTGTTTWSSRPDTGTTSTSFLASGPAGTPTRSPRWPTRCTPEPAGVTAYQLKKAGLKKKVKLSYVTSEPFLGHFGIGGLPHGEQLLGMFLKKEGITAITNVSMQHVDKDAIVLADSRELPFRYAVVVPPFVGQDFLKNVDGIADEKGYIKAGTPTRPRSSTTSTRSARKQRCADTGRQDAPASEHGVLIPGPQATR